MTQKQKFTLARIIISALMFVGMMLYAAGGRLNLLLFLVPYAIIGYDVLWGALLNIFRGRMLDEMFLMSVATIGAIVLGEYPEALAVMLFYQVGELFLDVSVNRSRESIAQLMDICPEYAVILRDNDEIKAEPSEVKIGDIIIVRPGERIPLDGVVVEGTTTLDTAALTGESAPRECGVGDRVVSGSVNLTGVIRAEVTSVYEESTVQRILELVESASDRKAKAEKFITKFARIYTPIVVALAVMLAVIPSLIDGQWSSWIHRALIFLVVSCPCALVISVPLAFFGGVGAAARQGILVKGSNYLEQLARVSTVVFDKTGTLTKGSFEVTDVHPEGVSEEELIRLAATAEFYSNHPIARSICKRNNAKTDEVKNITERIGMGVIADDIACGNRLLMEELGITPREVEGHGILVHVAKGGKYMGCLLIADRVKEGMADTVEILAEMGVDRIAMLTGDTTAVAEEVGIQTGIIERYSNLLPDEKVAKLEEIMADKPKSTAVCYIGDGINDAPVLAVADVGIAMGAMGSDAAIEAADVVLMDDDPVKVIRAMNIAGFTVHVAKQNIVFALAVKILVLILGALGIAGMWLAVFADVGVAVLATLNAMRTLKR